MDVAELSEYCTTEGKEMSRYAVRSARRLEDLNEFKSQSESLSLTVQFCHRNLIFQLLYLSVYERTATTHTPLCMDPSLRSCSWKMRKRSWTVKANKKNPSLSQKTRKYYLRQR